MNSKPSILHALLEYQTPTRRFLPEYHRVRAPRIDPNCVISKRFPCSQLSLQQEELELEEFQLIEKLQQLGINAGRSDDISLILHI